MISTCSPSVVAGELARLARHVLAAVLIGEVSAVVVRVALEGGRDAPPRAALKVAGAAGRCLGAVALLVAVVQAVVIAIAHPRLGKLHHYA